MLQLAAAAAADDPTFSLQTLANFGVLGLFVIAVFTKRLPTPGERDQWNREREMILADRDRERTGRERMEEFVRQEVVPALQGSTDVIARALDRQSRQ